MSLRCLSLALLAVSLTAGADGSAASSSGARRSFPVHVRFGGFYVGTGYGYFSGVPYGYFAYYYDPFLWSPLYYPGYYTGFDYHPGRGSVKLPPVGKSAVVFLNGAFAGDAGDLKDMWLQPGVYDLEVRTAATRFTKKIYVLSGKTLKLTAGTMNREPLP